MKSDEYLFDLLKAIAGKDKDAADIAICNLRIELVKSDEMPTVIDSAWDASTFDRSGTKHTFYRDHHFEFRYSEKINE